MKPEVGQRVFHLNIGNAARNRKQKLTPYVVTKVGRKYFTAAPEGNDNRLMENQYCIDSWFEKTDYSASSRLYATEQEWHDEQEINVLCREFRNTFEYGRNKENLPLPSLRAIKTIIMKTRRAK